MFACVMVLDRVPLAHKGMQRPHKSLKIPKSPHRYEQGRGGVGDHGLHSTAQLR